METLNIIEIAKQIKPNEKVILDEINNIKVFACKCKGAYKYEYLYNEKFFIIIKGFITLIHNNKKEIQLKENDIFTLKQNDKIEIKDSDALILGIID